jgi:hypothetical protein
MEPLWSPVVATGGNRSQIPRRRKAQNEAKNLAVGCDESPLQAHGKQGVCRGATGCGRSLPVKKEVDFLAPQNAKSCEPEGAQDLP